MRGNNVRRVPFGAGSRRVRARRRSTDHAAVITSQSVSARWVTIPDAGRRIRRSRRVPAGRTRSRGGAMLTLLRVAPRCARSAPAEARRRFPPDPRGGLLAGLHRCECKSRALPLFYGHPAASGTERRVSLGIAPIASLHSVPAFPPAAAPCCRSCGCLLTVLAAGDWLRCRGMRRCEAEKDGLLGICVSAMR